VFEQQSPSCAQLFPMVTQPAPGSGAQVPAVQVLEQHSPFPPQTLPLAAHPATVQTPAWQAPVQQVSPAPQGASGPTHIVDMFGASRPPPPRGPSASEIGASAEVPPVIDELPQADNTNARSTLWT